MNIELVCAALLLILYGALSFNVSLSRTRLREQKSTIEKVEHSARIHGNASEYIPMFIALFLYFSLTPVNWFTHFVVILATVSRILHAIGMSRIENVTQRHPLRFVGAIGTYFCIFVLAGLLLVKAF